MLTPKEAIFIDHKALAKQRDNALGSAPLSVNMRENKVLAKNKCNTVIIWGARSGFSQSDFFFGFSQFFFVRFFFFFCFN